MAKKTDILQKQPPGRIVNFKLTERDAITMRFMFAIDHIIAYRRYGCKSASAVAKIIGMSQQNLSKYRNGAQDATVEQIAKLCEYFDINDSYILRGKGNLEEMMPLTQRMDKLEAQLLELQNQVDLVLKNNKK